MKKIKTKKAYRALAVFLTLVVMAGTIPATAFADEPSNLTTTIPEEILVGESCEFSVTTNVNESDEGILVKGISNFDNPEALSEIKYLESNDGEWYDFDGGHFGPSTGFPLTDGATSYFKVTFSVVGTYTFKVSIVDAVDETELFSIEETIVVKEEKIAPVLTTNISEITFYQGVPTEFTFTTIANSYVDVNVIGTSNFSDPDAIEKLEYYEVKNDTWYDLNGDFGPENGFPMADATSRFRVTFKNPGEYTFTASMKDAHTDEILCSTDVSFEVIAVHEVKINAYDYNAGTVILKDWNGNESQDFLKIVNGENVTVSVTAKDGYQLTSVYFGDDKQTLTYPDRFEKSITDIEDDITITATFAKIYTVKYSFNENGSVSSNFKDVDTDGGRLISAIDGSTVVMKAQAEENYRVSKVVINGETILDCVDNLYADDKIYEFELIVDKDYDVEVTFAPKVYKVTTEETENGTILISPAQVFHGGNAAVTIEPSEGYVIDSILINGNVFDETSNFYSVIYDEKNDVKLDDNGNIKKISFSLADITEDISITVKFIKNTAIDLDVIKIDTTGVIKTNENDNLYVFANNKKATISITEEEYDKIKINDDKAQNSSASIEKTTVIEKLYVGKIKKFFLWTYTIWTKVELPSSGIKIVIDDEAPIVEINAPSDDEDTYYNTDVIIDVFTEDTNLKDETNKNIADSFSGINSIEYWITDDVEEKNITQGVGAEGAEKETGILYKWSDGDDIEKSVLTNITVSTLNGVNNTDHVKVHIKVTDRAGNESVGELSLKINTTPPEVTVSVKDIRNENALSGYYTKRIAIIEVKDRAGTFNPDGFVANIKKQDSETNIHYTSLINGDSVWSENEDVNILQLEFKNNGTYTWDISYTNKAELSCSFEEVKEYTQRKLSTAEDLFTEDEIKDIFNFTIDSEKPTGEILFNSTGWNKVADVLLFGLFFNTNVTVTSTIDDCYSPVHPAKYYKTNQIEIMSAEELEKLYEEGNFFTDTIDDSVVNKDGEILNVYVRAEDYAGNVTYISSDGVIVENSESKIAITEKSTDLKSASGFYNTDVPLDVSVIEEGTIYSGINLITYQIEKGELTDDGKINWVTTKTDKLYEFNSESERVTKDELIQAWPKENENSAEIIVNGEENNSDFVKVTVTAIDNAGNESSEEISLAICTDLPIIEVNFNDKDEVVQKQLVPDFFSEEREATITITNRPSVFSEEDATNGIVVAKTNVDGVKIDTLAELVETGDISIEWKHDGDKHIATLKFLTEGFYSWKLSYINKANLKCEFENVEVPDGISSDIKAAMFDFTIDMTNPTGIVEVNGNTWNRVLSVLTFMFAQDKVDVKATHTDNICKYNESYIVEFYETTNPDLLDDEDLEKIYHSGKFKTYEDYQVPANRQFVTYIRVTDNAGNFCYANTYGYIVDKEASVIIFDPEVPNANGIYNDSDGDGVVKVAVKVTDVTGSSDKITDPYSGLKSVNYRIEYMDSNGDVVKTDEDNLFTFDKENPARTDLVNTIDRVIEINQAENNRCNVIVYITAVDNAGNVNTASETFDIDITAPSVDISYDNNSDNNGNSYFDAQRTATIVVTERTHHFKKDKATESIEITAVDVNGAKVSDAYSVGSWETQEDPIDPNKATHTVKVVFQKDANYTVSFNYTDEADNKNNEISTGNSVHPYKFTVDTTAPSGSVKAVSDEGRSEEWTEIKSDLTFGFWSNTKITISGTSNDLTSPISSVKYYKNVSSNASDATTALTASELDRISNWSDFSGFSIADNEQCTVYLKITDAAGNVTYVSTNGLIVDKERPIEEAIAPQITTTPIQPVNGFYNGNVEVEIKVVDPITDGTYSGLSEVVYKVFDDAISTTVPTQEGTLYTFDISDPKQSELKQTWEGNITVDREKNNSNAVRIAVYAKDNALNTSDDKTEIKIDTTSPKIDIKYNNNSADSQKVFNANRTATVTITERNFNADDVKIDISNTEGTYPVISTWTNIAGSGNGDNSKWIATISYIADGDYKFSIKYADLAGNECEKVNYAEGTVAPTDFTIDKTTPIVNVSYDNNSAQNLNYYKAQRIATVSIREHNFNPERVLLTITATDDGKNVATPSLSSWTSNGDMHYATLRYAKDAKYTFDINFSDMAGNKAADFEKQTFFIDTTAPKLEISGVENNSANNGDVIPVVSYSDTNFDSSRVQMNLFGANRKSVEAVGSQVDSYNGGVFTFVNFEKVKEVDDIYTLTASLTDKAGNSSEKTITFSVNRFGSTYALSEDTENINGSFIKDSQDIIVTETNVNELENIKITLFMNNTTVVLTEGKDYRVDFTGGEGQWYKYTYTIFKSNFAEDGVYRLTVYSEDTAGNVAENTLDTKKAEINFGVDKTLPTINVKNLESGETYPVENLTVEMSANDNLNLTAVTVYLDDYSNVYKSWTSDELTEIIENSGDFTFDVSGASKDAHNVKVVAVDAAGNEYIEEITDFYVTTDIWVRYYNNKPLFFGTIGGGLLLIGLITFFIVTKRKKEE